MSSESEKTMMIGIVAENFPDRLNEILQRSKEISKEFVENIKKIDSDEDKAVELMAQSLFMVGIDELIEKEIK